MASSSRKAVYIILTLLGLVLLGTIAVLSTVQVYFGVDERDQITIQEADYWSHAATLPYGSDLSTSPGKEEWIGKNIVVEKIPRIIHQTWKDETLPERWQIVHDQCMEMNPEFEYMLWTDASSRDFIATHYAWFLESYDSYPYPIQRADAIRYFVLHHYGGIYMDLDIGCKRPLRPLLNFDIILPRTIPVGISNDLLFAAPRHPFMDLVTHNLVTFNHRYGTNYPTVMFSTGPMFLSAQYGMWPSVDGDRGGVRVLPKSLYGKNAKPEESEHSFFFHYYGSSWHADDAGFVTFLGKFGMVLMYGGAVVLVLGCLRLILSKRSCQNTANTAKAGPIALPFNTPVESNFNDSLFRSDLASPNASRPGSPSFGSKRSTQNSKGALFWVPFYSKDGAPPYPRPSTPPAIASASSQSWSSLLPTFLTYDSSSNQYQPISPYSRPTTPIPPHEDRQDTDNVSIHSLHTIKAGRSGRSRKNSHARQISYPSSSDDDLESQHFTAPGYSPVRKSSTAHDRPSSPSTSRRGLPPAYSNAWAHSLGRLFRTSRNSQDGGLAHSKSASTASNAEAGLVSSLLGVGIQESGSTLSRQGSFSSARSIPPPGYESDTDARVDQLLSEMEDPTLSTPKH